MKCYFEVKIADHLPYSATIPKITNKRTRWFYVTREESFSCVVGKRFYTKKKGLNYRVIHDYTDTTYKKTFIYTFRNNLVNINFKFVFLKKRRNKKMQIS